MPPNAFTKQTVESVRNALACCLAQPAAEPAPELRAALHTLAREARANRAAPEELLELLKSIWYDLPAVREESQPEQTRLLQQIVATSIKAYFADR